MLLCRKFSVKTLSQRLLVVAHTEQEGDPDDDPDELILAHLRVSLQEVKEGKTLTQISALFNPQS